MTENRILSYTGWGVFVSGSDLVKVASKLEAEDEDYDGICNIVPEGCDITYDHWAEFYEDRKMPIAAIYAPTNDNRLLTILNAFLDKHFPDHSPIEFINGEFDFS